MAVDNVNLNIPYDKSLFFTFLINANRLNAKPIFIK